MDRHFILELLNTHADIFSCAHPISPHSTDLDVTSNPDISGAKDQGEAREALPLSLVQGPYTRCLPKALP